MSIKSGHYFAQTDLYQSAFSNYSFGKLVFPLFVFSVYLCYEFDVIFKHYITFVCSHCFYRISYLRSCSCFIKAIYKNIIVSLIFYYDFSLVKTCFQSFFNKKIIYKKISGAVTKSKGEKAKSKNKISSKNLSQSI